MYVYPRVPFRRVLHLAALASVVALMTGAASAQEAKAASTDQAVPMAREGSGTAWLPDASPMYALHARRGPWELMTHGNGFAQFLHESGPRGADQFGSINWVMGVAQRSAGEGRFAVRGMFSLEPFTVRGCGYPDLLATGERCDGQPIHDRQHQHDLLMELSAQYDRPLTGSLRWQIYGGPAAEPALGPAAYPHRVSAMPNPIAPIAHHWLDSTHVTFGVITSGVYGRRWKAEASVFNGREPDQQRTDIDFGALDSLAGRFWFLPSPNWALQVSVGKLTEAEPGHEIGEAGPERTGPPRVTVTRATASATFQRPLRTNGTWATTAAWGRNAEEGHASHAVLVETSLAFGDRDTWFGKIEMVDKSAHDLVVAESGEAFALTKLQAGYTRYLRPSRGVQPGFGLVLSASIVPESLASVYGGRVTSGLGLFLTLRPARMPSHVHANRGLEGTARHQRTGP
jgi:hypothetical protein